MKTNTELLGNLARKRILNEIQNPSRKESDNHCSSLNKSVQEIWQIKNNQTRPQNYLVKKGVKCNYLNWKTAQPGCFQGSNVH